MYATGQAYTYATGRYARHDDPFSSNGAQNALTVEEINSARLPAYHRMDISFSRTGKFFKLGTSELQLQIINVYNRKNVWFKQIDFEENPLVQTDVTLLPTIPAISYTVNF